MMRSTKRSEGGLTHAWPILSQSDVSAQAVRPRLASLTAVGPHSLRSCGKGRSLRSR